MKKRILTFLTDILALTLSFTSCICALPENTYPADGTPSATSRLRLYIPQGNDTRSSIDPDEDKIGSICVIAYRESDGSLAAVQNSSSAEYIDMELPCGIYNIYITANMDDFHIPEKEGELVTEYHSIGYFSQLKNALPMCWNGKAELKPGENTTIHANLSRLVSKTGLKIDMGTIKGLDIKSVRLCQGAGKIWPFMEGGSRIEKPSDTMDGDHATEEDIRRLMAGETIWLYVTENCQGILLPDNTDPWAKVPDNIGNSAELCTYIEMIGEWKGTADYKGTVKYRFFLGEDTVSDFNIRRNSMNCITLYLEEGGFGRLNWKIDTSEMNPIYWNMSSTLENNLHDREDFYVTENIRIDFRFDKNGQIYWNNRNNAFIIAGVGENDETVIRFSEPVNLGEGRFYAIGTCLKEGYYDIVLKDAQTGEIKYFLEYGEIHTPVLVAGPEGNHTDNKVSEISVERDIFINKEGVEVCLYLVDRKGYNINQSNYYGCDLTIPDWNFSIRSNKNGNSLTAGASLRREIGECGSDSYAVKCMLSIENDGMIPEWNVRLAENLGPKMLNITFEDMFSEASYTTKMGLYCDDISVTLMCVPDELKSFFQSEFMYALENPANLPVKIRGLKMNGMHSIPSRNNVMPVICYHVTDFTNNTPVLISKMPTTYCSLEDEDVRWDIIGGKFCFAANDNSIEEYQIPNQIAMFHTFEADLAYDKATWKPRITGNINLYDTQANSTKYGINGYMNCGMAFYSPGSSNIIYDSNNGKRVDFRKYGNLIKKEYIGWFNDIIEVQIGINENNEITARASRNADLNISISGSLNGHIRCVTIQDPLFTLWGHYFAESVTFAHSQTFSLGTEPIVIDDGLLANAFVEMREIPYYSVVDAWDLDEFRVNDYQTGTIREYLKPYGIDLSIKISSPDGTAIIAKCSGTTVYDYKTSNPVTWDTGVLSRVTMVPSSYSGFDDGLQNDGCPPGSLFAGEKLYLQPNVTLNNFPGIYYMK